MGLGFAVGLCVLLQCGPAPAQPDTKPAAPPEEAVAPLLKGKKSLVLNSKFTTPKSNVKEMTAGEGYASVRFSIGTSTQRDNIRRILQYMAETVPAQFGNSSGTYTVTITLTDLNNKLLVKEPILSFQWLKERQLIIFEKTVSEVQKTSWKGTLIEQMPVTQANQRLKVTVDVSFQKDRSLDFEILKKAAKTFSSGAVATYLPLPAAAVPVIESITGLMNDLYSGSEKRSLVEEDELTLADGNPVMRAGITIKTGETQWTLPILFSVDTRQSRLVSGGLANSKFDKSKLSESIFTNTQVSVGEGKTVALVELMATSEDAKFKRTRSLLDAVLAGSSYGKDPNNKKEEDLAERCGDLYDALNAFLSRYDSRAMFWAFLQRYGDRIDKNVCLSQRRRTELAEVGLDL
jgi:hypothetical protein